MSISWIFETYSGEKMKKYVIPSFVLNRDITLVLNCTSFRFYIIVYNLGYHISDSFVFRSYFSFHITPKRLA